MSSTNKRNSKLNKVKKSSNIQVYVRIRPLTLSECETNHKYYTRQLDDKVAILLDPNVDLNAPEEIFRINRSREKHFTFDKVFDHDSEQPDIFAASTQPLIDGVTNGYNATVFAYGATGAGKTYTMLGAPQQPGIMLQTLKEIFDCIQANSEDREYQVKLSYLEIYNELIRDLISASNEFLDVREDSVKGVIVAGLSELHVISPEEVMDILMQSNWNRTTEPTMANLVSSRSHAVLNINVEYRGRALADEITTGKLRLIDLAGSERAARTQNRGQRMVEGANINRSLLALGNCINALFEANEKNSKIHIPYRDSKLTRLLKDSLGGNCRTVMIACVSPYIANYEDTQNTLKYANRAKNIKTRVKKNVTNAQFYISEYNSIINKLKQEITNLRGRLKANVNPEDPNSLPSMENIEKFTIDIHDHFKAEAEKRKEIQEIELGIQQKSFILNGKLREKNAATKSQSTEGLGQLNLDIDELKKHIKAQEQALDREMNAAKELEDVREQFRPSLISNINNTVMDQLELIYKQNVLILDNLSLKNKEEQNENILKQKDEYISYLERQLQLRDRIINEQNSTLKNINIESRTQTESEEPTLEQIPLDPPDIPLELQGQKIAGVTVIQKPPPVDAAFPPMKSQSRIPKPKITPMDPASIADTLKVNNKSSQEADFGRGTKARNNRFKRRLDNTRSSSVISHKKQKQPESNYKLSGLNLEIVAEKIGRKKAGTNLKVGSPRRLNK